MKAERSVVEASLNVAKEKWRMARAWRTTDGQDLESGMPWKRILPMVPNLKNKLARGILENTSVCVI